eukprot:6908813-Pyramimonas_sp.AAC.1
MMFRRQRICYLTSNASKMKKKEKTLSWMTNMARSKKYYQRQRQLPHRPSRHPWKPSRVHIRRQPQQRASHPCRLPHQLGSA